MSDEQADHSAESARGNSPVFATTHWSVVLAAGHDSAPGAQEALERLCRAYWYPLYCFVRRQGHPPEDAQDLTQGFFARFLEKHSLDLADSTRGRFRTFLLACLTNYLAEERRYAGRVKRGGDQTLVSWDAQSAEERYRSEPLEQLTPEKAYERKWALALLEQTLARLSQEESAADKARLFAALKDFLWGEKGSASYAQIGAPLEMSEGAVKVAVHRLRRRYRELLRASGQVSVLTIDTVLVISTVVQQVGDVSPSSQVQPLRDPSY